MSLKQFLAIGRSVKGMKTERSPYEMRAATLLPKFQPNISGSSAPASGLATGSVSASERRISFWARVSFLFRAAAKSRVGDGENPPVQISKAAGGKSIFRRSFFPARGRKSDAASKPIKTLVQSELSLEAVRVVRNDLCDTDLEIVTCFRQSEGTAKSAPARTNTTSEPVEEQSEFAKAAAQPGWSRLTARLFDTGGIGHG